MFPLRPIFKHPSIYYIFQLTVCSLLLLFIATSLVNFFFIPTRNIIIQLFPSSYYKNIISFPSGAAVITGTTDIPRTAVVRIQSRYHGKDSFHLILYDYGGIRDTQIGLEVTGTGVTHIVTPTFPSGINLFPGNPAQLPRRLCEKKWEVE